jgi:hypothetical protein
VPEGYKHVTLQVDARAAPLHARDAVTIVIRTVLAALNKYCTHA